MFVPFSLHFLFLFSCFTFSQSLLSMPLIWMYPRWALFIPAFLGLIVEAYLVYQGVTFEEEGWNYAQVITRKRE